MGLIANHPGQAARAALGAGLVLGLGLCSCSKPSIVVAPAPQAALATQTAPQFNFASWNQVKPLIKAGRVIQTVNGKGGLSLILDNRNWIHIVAKPGDPLPKNPMDYIYRNAPNAGDIKQVHE